jgi:hypothetical protein
MQYEQKTTHLLTVEVDPMKCARARVGKNTPKIVGAVPVDGGECGRWRRTSVAVGSAESEEADASAEKVGFSPVWTPGSWRSDGNIGAWIGDTEDATLKCRLRLDRQRAARGWKSRRRGERSRRGWKSRRRFPESWRGWGFAVMETDPGSKGANRGARQYLYGIWKVSRLWMHVRSYFGWGFL